MDRARLRRALPAATALLLSAVLATPAAAALSADSMYEPTTVVVIDLQLPPASIEALEADPDEYVEGAFTLAETEGTPASAKPYFEPPLTVGVRLKGNASFEGLDGKAALKVKFDEFVDDQTYLGLEKLTLNNMVQDPSMLHEALAYEGFAAAGVPAPAAGYAYVYLNGIDYGLHLNLETLDKIALEKRFGPFANPPQHLYEGQPFVDLLPGTAGEFEVDEGKNKTRTDLEALIAAANADTPSFTSRLTPVADLAEMVRLWAAERYLGQWDGYSGPNVNNYYLYSSDTGVFQMLPWGTDQSLSSSTYPFVGNGGGILFEQCLAEQACLTAYREALEAVDESTAALDPVGLATQLAEQLAPWQARELAESERWKFNAAQIEAGVETTVAFLAKRPGALATWLAGPPEEEPTAPPIPPAPPPGAEPARISGRLELDRSRLGRGILIARPKVSADGAVSITGTIGPAGKRRAACLLETVAAKAGQVVLLCNLTSLVRKRLASAPRTLRLRVALDPDGDGPRQTRTRSVRLPRQALG